MKRTNRTARLLASALKSASREARGPGGLRSGVAQKLDIELRRFILEKSFDSHCFAMWLRMRGGVG